MRIGLIGTGFMGRAHVLGYAAAARAFALPSPIEFVAVADVTAEAAERARAAFGFARATADWGDLLADPAIDVIDITAPNALHKEMALAAIAAGKHVYCEKPLAPLAADALEMTRAAEVAGRVTQVGFNYLMNPLFGLAREMIAGGELGEIYSYRGVHAEDYMADPAAPFSFRHEPAGGGALADIGSHALATAEYLLGPIAEVSAQSTTLIPQRRDPLGTLRTVEVDDVTHAFLRFERGAVGAVEANWCATGRTMQHAFEVYGSKGALHFTGERLNELHWYDTADRAGRGGFRRIEAGPAHPPYGAFCVAPGHQLGFNDLKAIEVAGFARAIAGEAPEPFNFRAGWRIQSLVERVQSAAREGGWVDAREAA
ncbi:MAG: Gfo/Idh/MocA family oxidoreductase [Alphaproteobacteria bacterium]|jgi:predicted dehydrogenase|nr:Gfo/Idh/MocA family oxidoreductase [Alphaproteobacteria bacterium]